jgi:hypothetical protein
MRRKNRQIKLIVDIPDDFETDEDFMEAFEAKMDHAEWQLTIPKEAPDEDEEIDDDDLIAVLINRVDLGDITLEPELED